MALNKFAFILLLLIARVTSAQVLTSFSNPSGTINWNDCRGNQMKIYQKLSFEIDSKIGRLYLGLNEEIQYFPESKSIPLFVDEILRLGATKHLFDFYAQTLSTSPFSQSIFAGKEPTLTVNTLIDSTKISAKRNLQIKNDQFLLKRVEKSLLKTIASHAITGNPLRFTSFTSLWSLLTIPLSASALPEETKWTDLLHKYPELMVNPEVMRDLKIGYGFPWRTQCAALAGRTSSVEWALKKLIKRNETQFLGLASSLADLRYGMPERSDSLISNKKPSIDNTYVYRRPLEPFLPDWARK